jgi:hypothetical protein
MSHIAQFDEPVDGPQ